MFVSFHFKCGVRIVNNSVSCCQVDTFRHLTCLIYSKYLVSIMVIGQGLQTNRCEHGYGLYGVRRICIKVSFIVFLNFPMPIFFSTRNYHKRDEKFKTNLIELQLSIYILLHVCYLYLCVKQAHNIIWPSA